ncbi:MAG: D-serine ammonia-lyase [Deltaproteobacteria bacterium]|nr:D-serine ammonia-lyase [Candidatus Zymogenaceae bacterium]
MNIPFEDHPIIDRVKSRTPLFWENTIKLNTSSVLPTLPLGIKDIEDAQNRLDRFAPVIRELFPETRPRNGIIESDLINAAPLAGDLAEYYNTPLPGRYFIKADHALPVAGSVKARGGIYEVLCFAEEAAKKNGLICESDSYLALLSPDAKKLFSVHTLSVGSTGNLGLSIGVTGATFGFHTQVHMSADAKPWKKKLLRSRGVEVIEHDGDYTAAVAAGRRAIEGNPRAHFVDDEDSKLLFLGYSVAALRLKKQLDDENILVDDRHPLFLWLPCGVGGAPGGITFGMKHLFGDAVRCFFSEPVDAPAFLIGILTDFSGSVSVYDVGLTNDTIADGLAVGAPSVLVGNLVKHLVSGCVTVSDDDLFRFTALAHRSMALKLEPSATAGFIGPLSLFTTQEGRAYIESNLDPASVEGATHIIWTTGGSLVPEKEFREFLETGNRLTNTS